MCHQFYFNLINVIILDVYGVLYLLNGVVAVAGNLISAKIMWRREMKQTHSNLILKSLIISDALVGCISCPVHSYQLLTQSYLNNCNYERIRDFIGLSLASTSSLTVTMIALDRYLLLTKLNNYSKYMNKKKIKILLVIVWIFPPVASTLRYANFTLYRYVYVVAVISSTLVISISYFLVLKEIHRKRKRLQSVQKRDMITSVHHHHTHLQLGHSANKRIQEDFELKLAKKVTFLVMCFLICIIPSVITVVVRAFIQPNELTSSSLQNAYLFSFFIAALNSSINPFIYASKYPEFQTHLKEMFTCTIGRHKAQDLTTIQ